MIRNNYVIHPGFGRATPDGQRVYLNGYKLALLYGVDPVRSSIFMRGVVYPDQAIHLHPQLNGVYALPT